jgi:hypothetical protein
MLNAGLTTRVQRHVYIPSSLAVFSGTAGSSTFQRPACVVVAFLAASINTILLTASQNSNNIPILTIVSGMDVINRMKRPYSLIDNNCQLFTVNLLNQICEGRVEELFSSWKLVHMEPEKLKTSTAAALARETMLNNTPPAQKK